MNKKGQIEKPISIWMYVCVNINLNNRICFYYPVTKKMNKIEKKIFMRVCYDRDREMGIPIKGLL